jgi:outer membrane protein
MLTLAGGCFSPGHFEYEAVVIEYAPSPDQQLVALSPEVEERPLTLPQAIGLALEHNPGQEQAVARIRQARAAVAETRSAFWPQVSAFSEYLQGDAPSAFLFKRIDARKLPPDADFNDPGWFENWETGLQAQWNLYTGGRDRLRSAIADRELRISHLDQYRLTNELTALVIDTYYSALAARELVATASQAVATVQRQLELIRVRYQAGGVLKSDLLSLQVRLAAAEEDLVQARNNADQIPAALAILLGLGADAALRLAPAGSLELALPRTYESALLQAMERRPELARAREQVVRARMGLALARAEHLPQLDLQLKYYFGDPNFFAYSQERENWTLGLMLNWELFSGYATRSRIAQADGRVRQMLAVDREQVLSMQLEVKQTLLALDAAEARVQVSRESVAEAEEVLRLVALEYEGGSATISRFLDAELARNQARFRETQAVYDYEKAMANLGRALGCWVAGSSGPGWPEIRMDPRCGFISDSF